ncbi:MAG: PEP-CTERM sorting domain-containing protein [Thermoguttaceae bacterium]
MPDATQTALFTDIGLSSGNTIDLGGDRSVGGLLLDTATNFTIDGSSGALTIGSGGLVRSSNSSDTQTISRPVNLGANIVSIAGTGGLNLAGGGTKSGAFTIASGATLGFTGGTYNLSGATFSNSGTINFYGATVSSNSPTTISGIVNFGLGTLSSTSTVTFTGLLNWTGGTMSGNGTTLIQGSTNYFYDDLILDGRTMTNTGQTAFSPYFSSSFCTDTRLYGRNGAIFNNQLGATVILQGPTWFINDGGTAPTINNYGTFGMNAQTGCPVEIEFAMNNTGTVIVNGTGAVMNLSGGGTSSGTFTVASYATLGFTDGAHNLSGATFTNSGTINFSGAIVSFNSPKSIPGKVNFSLGTFNGTGTMTFTGSFNWTGGTMSGNGTTVTQGGTNYFYGNLILDGRTLTNTGSSTFSPYTIYTNTHLYGRNGAIINNQSGAYLYLQGPTWFINDSGTLPTINNYGTFSTNPQTGCPIDIEFAMNNTGTVQVNGTGTVMNLSGGGTSSGTFFVNSGATLGFTGGTHNLSGATFNNSGTINFGGATVSFNSPKSIPGRVNFSLGTLNGTGTETFTGTFYWTGGTMSGNGTTVIGGGVNYFYGDLILDGRTLTNIGTTWFSSADGSLGTTTYLYGRNGAIFNNQSGTYLYLQGPTYFINDSGTAPTINNYGTFYANLVTGCPIQIEFAMNNTGAVQVNGTGTVMNLSGGGTSSGTFNVASYATLGFTGGTHNLSGATFANSGTINFSGATVSFNSPKTIPGKFNFTLGTLNGTGTVTFTGSFNWTGGTMSDNGTTVTQGGINYFNGDLILDGHTLTNMGASVFSPYFSSSFYTNTHLYGRNGAVFNNQTGATVTLQGPTWFINDVGTAPTINNYGMFYAAPQTGTINISFAMNNTGTVEVQTGTLILQGGVTQLVGNTLTGGTWNVRSNSTLDITTGGNITTNQGSVTLDGVGSIFTKINTLSDNQGNFSVLNGRNFTTIADLANSGTLTVGADSEFTVTGNLTGTGITIVDGMLTADSIVQNTLTIGDGTTLTINPIGGGLLGDGTIQAVPEPGTLIMLLIAAAAAGWMRKSARRISRGF